MSAFSSHVPPANRPPLRVRRVDEPGLDRLFTDAFRIGRDAACELQVNSGLISREHAEVTHEDGQWWVRDLNSTNGSFVDGQRIDTVAVDGSLTVQFGANGPRLRLDVEPAAGAATARPAAQDAAPRPRPLGATPDERAPLTKLESTRAEQPAASHGAAPDEAAAPGAAAPGRDPVAHRSAAPDQAADPSMSQIIDRYFEGTDDTPAGERTMLIRHAYKEVKKKDQRRYGWIILVVVLVGLLALTYAGIQHVRAERLAGQASTIFYQMKEQEVTIAQVRSIVEASGGADVREQLDRLEVQRERLAEQYEGYVKELGLYRKLSEEEELIFRVARIFNENEFGMPAGFVREVRRVIRDHWQGPGRGTFITAVNRAQENGYIPVIVQAMQEQGLPPEFFYLAMQESVFNVNAVGPATRWGIAKGMWQFIPSTGQRYGLRIGPRADTRAVDPLDERHDFRSATQAAARYLAYIYGTEAQASGLLVIASYNWGEHRVVKKLGELPGPQAIPQAAFEGIPEDPSQRNYWRFLEEYEERMPEETKDYVLKIFAAAVIGQNPRLFGFDFDNPLQPYLEAPTAAAHAAAEGVR